MKYFAPTTAVARPRLVPTEAEPAVAELLEHAWGPDDIEYAEEIRSTKYGLYVDDDDISMGERSTEV